MVDKTKETDNKENTGDRNTGDRNTGDRNTGNRNTGDRNTGDWNTGDRNTGYWNTGDWNTGNRNTGYCNTISPNEILVFNVMTNIENLSFPNYFYFKLIEFIPASDMTDEEKCEFEEFETIGGYLKESRYKEAFIKSFNEASVEDVKKTLDIPNFNYDIFEEISGITKEMFDTKLGVSKKETETIELNGKTYRLIENE